MGHICIDCGAVFAEPHQRLLDGACWESSVCPYCGSTTIENAYECRMCGADIPERQDAFHLCAECEAKTAVIFQKHLDSYTAEQLAFLNWKWEGIEFERSKT